MPHAGICEGPARKDRPYCDWALLSVPVGPVSSTNRRISHSLDPREVQTTVHQSLADTEMIAWGQTTLTNTLCPLVTDEHVDGPGRL